MEYSDRAVAVAKKFSTVRFSYDELYSVALAALWQASLEYEDRRSTKGFGPFAYLNCRNAVIDFLRASSNNTRNNRRRLTVKMKRAAQLDYQRASEEVSDGRDDFQRVDARDFLEYYRIPTTYVHRKPIKVGVNQGKQSTPITVDGVTKSLQEWADLSRLHFRCLYGRIYRAGGMGNAGPVIRHAASHPGLRLPRGGRASS